MGKFLAAILLLSWSFFILVGCTGAPQGMDLATEVSLTGTSELSQAPPSAAPSRPPNTAAPSNPIPERTNTTVESSEMDHTGYESSIEQAKMDLAERLKVEPQAIELERFELVVWPDGSLGCPQPGMAYVQVQREGYRILLRYQERIYAYHGGEGQAPFLCLSPSTPPGFSPLP